MNDWNNPLSPIFDALQTFYGRAVAVGIASLLTVLATMNLASAEQLVAGGRWFSALGCVGIAVLLGVVGGVCLHVVLDLSPPASQTMTLLGATALTTAVGWGLLRFLSIGMVEIGLRDAEDNALAERIRSISPGLWSLAFVLVAAPLLLLQLGSRRRLAHEDKAVRFGRRLLCHACEQDLSKAIERADEHCPHCGEPIHPVAVRAAHRKWKRLR